MKLCISPKEGRFMVMPEPIDSDPLVQQGMELAEKAFIKKAIEAGCVILERP